MKIKEQYSFQVDSEIVKNVYKNQNNYLIEYSADVSDKYCIIYFTSNDLYYPNNEIAFRQRVVVKNHFEWYKTRINYGYKHIFVRDVQKQFYLSGINSKINNSQKFFSFLKDETKGFRIITIGCSAGGFAAVTYGQKLNAERIYSFNGGFEIGSKLHTSTETINPLIFRNRSNKKFDNWLNTINFITNPSAIYYFQSIKSEWDQNQYAHVKDLPINRIQFINSRHGIPFLKTNLPYVINLSSKDLLKLTGRIIHPVVFSIKTVGIIQTIFGLMAIIKLGMKKIVSMINFTI